MARTFSAAELADETGVPADRIEWLVGIGVLRPGDEGAFRFGDVFRVKLVAALLGGGFTSEQVEWAVSEGHLNLDRVDEYQIVEPGPRSTRTFAEFMAALGPSASLLPAVYAALGLPPPDPSAPLHTDEEERLQRFLEGWGRTRSDEALIRAARLIAEGTRLATLGWAELMDEQVAGPVRERLYRGEIDRFPEDVRQTFSVLLHLQPPMMEWLIQRYNEQRSAAVIVEGFEEFFASRGLGPPPRPTPPPSVVFIDLSGYTRLTEERGDEAAVRSASTLQREAEAVAAAKGGRLVKLLGDGAMLLFRDAERGLAAALSLVRTLTASGSLPPHAGVHAGPVIERDLDLFGRTVNLASRIADAAGPGEVLVSEAVVEAIDRSDVRFEPAGGAELKGIPEPVLLFRALVD
ncbi:MAG: adenylate/guanylate cyclase domain-containing protein [Actinomycetota bacterium]